MKRPEVVPITSLRLFRAEKDQTTTPEEGFVRPEEIRPREYLAGRMFVSPRGWLDCSSRRVVGA